MIKSYFLDRTQRVQIDGILCEYAKIVCGLWSSARVSFRTFKILPLYVTAEYHFIVSQDWLSCTC